jgi:hypothetical protein
VVETNRDDDCSPAAFSAFIESLLGTPETGVEEIAAADALRELRADCKE